jgi:hypothetical protein
VYHLNSSKTSDSSHIVDVATLTMTIPFPLQEALRDSITSGTFVDTKFWVFSKRGSRSGRVGEPKALFVNGHVAKRVPRLASRAAVLSCPRYFGTNSLTVLDERGAKENLRARFPTDRKPYTTRYDYEDDSDLEEDDDEDDIQTTSPRARSGRDGEAEKQLRCCRSRKLGREEQRTSDIVSVSDLDSLFSESSDTKGETETASSAHVGKVVVIEDVAFVT